MLSVAQLAVTVTKLPIGRTHRAETATSIIAMDVSRLTLLYPVIVRVACADSNIPRIVFYRRFTRTRW